MGTWSLWDRQLRVSMRSGLRSSGSGFAGEGSMANLARLQEHRHCGRVLGFIALGFQGFRA